MTSARRTEIEIGKRLARARLSRNIRQTDLARKSGIGVGTLRRLEAGGPSTFNTFLRVMESLDLEEGVKELLSYLPDGDITPMERMRILEGRSGRRRARPKEEGPVSPWTWRNEAP